MPALTLIKMVQCRPIRAGYSLQYLASMKDPRQVKCIDRSSFSLSARILHILTDVTLLCVPIFVIAQLQMPWSKKCRLGAVFAIGGMSTIASIVRNVIIVHPMEDATWELYRVYPWNIIDVTFAVIVASLPALNAIVDKSIKRAKSYAVSEQSSLKGLLSRIKNYVTLHSHRPSSTTYVNDSDGSDVKPFTEVKGSKHKPVQEQ